MKGITRINKTMVCTRNCMSLLVLGDSHSDRALWFQLCDCVLSRLTQAPMGIETRWHPVWYMIEKLHFLMLRRIEIFSSTSQVSVEIPLASGSTLCALIPSCSIQLFSFFARAEPERADDFSGTAGSKITRTTVQPSKLKMSGCGRLT
jgi:hypothetical protein